MYIIELKNENSGMLFAIAVELVVAGAGTELYYIIRSKLGFFYVARILHVGVCARTKESSVYRLKIILTMLNTS